MARNGGPRLSPQQVGDAPRSAAEAYEIQRLVAQAIGPIGGFKIARRPGQPQIMAPIFRKDVRTSPAIFARHEIDRIGVELEVGFLVKAPLPDPEDEAFATRARDCVSAVPVLEIVDTRLAHLESASPLLRLADNQINGALVVGTPCDEWQGLQLETVNARLTFGSQTVLDGPSPVPGGDAFETFLHLVRMVGPHCGGLKPGHVVITGSLNGLPFIERGTAVRGWIEGLGEIAADFPL
jgi:2-keto-4-pentenoate hydratase